MTRRLSRRAPGAMKLMALLSLVCWGVFLLLRADVFMGARLGEKKAQSALPLLVLLSAGPQEKHR